MAEVKNDNRNYRVFAGFFGVLLSYLGGGLLFHGCSADRFIKADIEKRDGVTGVLATCWRAQKDNAASGGGNTRNCDPIQDEYLRQEKMMVCRSATITAQKCLCSIYRVCDQAE